MLTSFPFLVLLGTGLGFLSGIGVGGGSLLILWLTLVLQLPPETARGINLLFFLPCALTASFFRWRKGGLAPGRILPAILSGCIAAGIFSWLGAGLDTLLLRRLFGILLLATGLRELFYRPKG